MFLLKEETLTIARRERHHNEDEDVKVGMDVIKRELILFSKYKYFIFLV